MGNSRSKTKLDQATPLGYVGGSASDYGLVTGYEGSPFFEAASLALLTGTLVYSEALRAFMRAAQQDPRYSSYTVVSNAPKGKGSAGWDYLRAGARAEDTPATERGPGAARYFASNALPSVKSLAEGVVPKIYVRDSESWHPDYTFQLLFACKLALSNAELADLLLTYTFQILLSLGPKHIEEIADPTLILRAHERRHGHIRHLLPLMVCPGWRGFIVERYPRACPASYDVMVVLGVVPLEYENSLFRLYMEIQKGTVRLHDLDNVILNSKGPFLASLLGEVKSQKLADPAYLDKLYQYLAFGEGLWRISHCARVDSRRNMRIALLELYGLDSLRKRLNGLTRYVCRAVKINVELYETLAEMCKPLLISSYFTPDEVFWVVRSLGKNSNIVFADTALESIKAGYAEMYLKYAVAVPASSTTGFDGLRTGEFMDWLTFYGDHSCDRAKGTRELYYALIGRDPL